MTPTLATTKAGSNACWRSINSIATTSISVSCCARLGTPAPRYPSGAIEEFEGALEGRRRRGQPAEVFFYFLGDPATRPAAVEDFRGSLAARGFLYSSAPDGDAFAERPQSHLLHVVRGWHSWRNRLRRFLHDGASLARAAAGALLVAYCALEIATVSSVRREIRSGRHEAAVATWAARTRCLPVAAVLLAEDWQRLQALASPAAPGNGAAEASAARALLIHGLCLAGRRSG